MRAETSTVGSGKSNPWSSAGAERTGCWVVLYMPAANWTTPATPFGPATTARAQHGSPVAVALLPAKATKPPVPNASSGTEQQPWHRATYSSALLTSLASVEPDDKRALVA